MAESNSTDFFDSQTLFTHVLLPVPVQKLFTYRVPKGWEGNVKEGLRVIVPFGSRRILTGIIWSISQNPPRDYEAKYILEVLDETEVLYEQQKKLIEWIAGYYLCSAGEVMNAALPSGLKLSSESMVQLHPAFSLEFTDEKFSEKELLLLTHLQSKALSYTEAAKLLDTKSIYHILKSLSSKSAIILFEEVRDKYKPKTETRVRLSAAYTDKTKLEALFIELESKPKQEALLLKYLQEVPILANEQLNSKGIEKTKLLSNDQSASALKTLIKHNVLEEFEVVVPRFGSADEYTAPTLMLSEAQEAARNQILQLFLEKSVVLLHGVTGSGKTEIYIDLIRKALDGGSQVLLLLPEIALTTQIVSRLKKVFGNELGIYHSKFSDNERVEVWNGVLQGKLRLVIGVRSSIFLPFDNLGLIIVDEEHDSSYKQQDPAPRYHARDVAFIVAQIHQAKLLLGSATPSAETFYQAHRRKLGYVALNQRFGYAQLPEIIFADKAKEKFRKTNKGDFTSALLNSIRATLEEKNQVIIFQNRRGHSPIVQCQDCTWVPKCINCAVSLTYHQFKHHLICHYCGYKEDLPNQCPTCSSRRIITIGYGTERLEEELKIHFPAAEIERMDLETTRSKSSYDHLIDNFQRGDTNILVGTQMVTKGLDFEKVNLVGIFDADRMMHFPDFRSHERAFQLITQVAGRAGRREKKGLVVVQTSNPQHPLFTYVARHDVNGFLLQELNDRQKHFYPPFSRLIEVTFKHADKKTCMEAAQKMAETWRQSLPQIKILGPGEPMISKIRNEYLMTVLIKIARGQADLGGIKATLLQAANTYQNDKRHRTVKIVFDVDAM